jgi:hypothetical protein
MEQAPTTRTCKKCSTEKKLSEFTIIKKCRYGRGYICKECKNKSRFEIRNLPHNKIKQAERWKIYKEKNKELVNERARIAKRKSFYNNYEKYREQKRRYIDKNEEKIKQKYKEIWKKAVETLDEKYLKSLLCKKLKVLSKDITEEQLQLQKESILLHREFEQLKQQIQ